MALIKAKIRVGHSPDPDDAFMFYGIAHDKIKTDGITFSHVIEDIESLRSAPPQGVVPPGMSFPPGVVGGDPNAVPKPTLTKVARTDMQVVGTILNPRPTGVMNPKFRPTAR